ncbi:MAG: nitroreductase family protein, partial [Bacteroidales bacterium]
MNAKDIINAFEFRFACKKFNHEKKIKDSDFHVILEAGRLSPSSFGFEPTHLLVVQNPLLREKIKDVAWGQGQVTSCSHLVLLLTLKPEYMKADSDHLKKFLLQVKQLQNDDLAMRLKYYEHFLKDEYKLLDNEQKMLDWSSKQAY